MPFGGKLYFEREIFREEPLLMKWSLGGDNLEVSENWLAITGNHWIKGKILP